MKYPVRTGRRGTGKEESVNRQGGIGKEELDEEG